MVGSRAQHKQRLRGVAMFKLLAQTSFLKKVKLMQIHRIQEKKSHKLNKIR